MNDHRRQRGFFFPLLLIALGVLLLMDNLGMFPGRTADTYLRYWPVLLIFAGLDSVYRHNAPIGAASTIGLGLAFLMSNLGYLSAGVGELFFQLWPVIVIGWGLDLALGHRGGIMAFVRLLFGAALIGGTIWLAAASPQISQPARTVLVTQRLEDIQSASINVNMPAGRLVLVESAEVSQLVEGQINLIGNETVKQDYTVSNARGEFILESRHIGFSVPFGGTLKQSEWNLKLHPTLPTSLAFRLGVGEQLIDLSPFTVNSFNLQAAIGRLTITLPTNRDVQGKIEMAVGDTTIYVPQNSSVRIQTHTGAVLTNLPDGYQKNHDVITSLDDRQGAHKIELSIDQAVGRLIIKKIP